ncbi:MAG TPA: hypothetical protein VNJ12_13350 [Candidatus Dormibacteraeota bacterium]|nr:hypothetical protein [Candidatus Dormibacteraeota bacterium]
MSIIHRLWPQETPAPDQDLPLAQRLKDLVGTDDPNTSENAAAEPATPTPASGPTPRIETPKSGAETRKASVPQAQQAGQHVVQGPARQNREQQEKPMDNRNPEIAAAQVEVQAHADTEKASPERASSSPESKGPGQQFMERFHSAVGRTEPTGEKSPAAGWEAAPEFQTIQKQFEADFRKRLDGALAEFERRVSSQALVDDVAGQIEQRIRLVADGIFKEVKNQAWMMHTAVASELRSFRDQFSKEIDERVGMLDQAAQQALALKEKLEKALPKAEDALRTLSVSGQEAAARLQAASKDSEDRLRQSHEELSRDLGARREDLQALAQGLHQDGLQLKEQMERFRGEAGAACDLLGQTTDQSLEKLGVAANEAGAHAKDEIEKLATEIERRILSGGLVERATEQLGKATQELVEPALERIRKAGDQAHSAAESLAGESQRVARQLAAARQQIEARLDGLLGEQLSLLEGAMSGFHRKASEELGSMVERVVTQSASQLDDRLHGLLQDLFANTSKQINTAARATLSNMNEGLKEAFRADSADPAAAPAPPSANE